MNPFGTKWKGRRDWATKKNNSNIMWGDALTLCTVHTYSVAEKNTKVHYASAVSSKNIPLLRLSIVWHLVE